MHPASTPTDRRRRVQLEMASSSAGAADSNNEAASAWPAPPRFYLEPRRAPPAPPAGEFQMYGVVRPAVGTLPPVPALEEQLYQAETEAEAITELRRLNRTLLSTFLELLRSMQETPTKCGTKVGEIRALLLNVQHLLNSLRPFQAREELIAAVQAQVDGKRRLIEELRGACEEAAQCGQLQDEEPAPMEEEQSVADDGGGAGPSEASVAAREMLTKLAQGMS